MTTDNNIKIIIQHKLRTKLYRVTATVDRLPLTMYKFAIYPKLTIGNL